LFLVGSLKPIEIDYSALSERFEDPRVNQNLELLGIHDPQTLLALQLFSPLTVEFIASLTHIENTDDNHWLEYRAPRDLFQTHNATLISQRDERLISSPSLFWSHWVRSREMEPQFLPTLTTLTNDAVAASGLAEAYRMAHFHSTSLDLNSGALEVDEYLPEDFWRKNPLTLEQIATRMDSFLENDQAALAHSLVNEYYSPIMLETTLSSSMADFWTQNAERWYESASSRIKPVMRNLLIDILAITGQTQRHADLLKEAVLSEEPPAADWAVLRACRLDDEYCIGVVNHYLQTNPALWLGNFAALRFPEFTEHPDNSR
jgi:hypothetical protein